MGLFSRWFGRGGDAHGQTASHWRGPEGERVYAIGDVHGRLDLLDALLATIAADHAARGGGARRLVLLGDLIDRGPDSAAVVERVRTLVADDPAAQCLAGNHEEILLLSLDGNTEALKLFSRIGGQETLASYGVGSADFHRLPDEELIERMRAALPAEHVAFLRGLPNQVRAGDYLFVHAGIRPGVPLDEQRIADLRWIRSSFLTSEADHGVCVVHGHTVVDAVEVRDNRIAIDTGAYAGGALTAIGIDGGERWFLTAGPQE